MSEKPRRPGQNQTKYRSICLLDTIGEVFEQLLSLRLKKLDILEHQHGFKEDHLTIGAVEEVFKIALHANNGTWRTRELFLLVTVDVKNVFNSAPWRKITDSLKAKCCPPYLKRIMKSYLSNGSLTIDGAEVEVTGAVA